MNTTWYWRAHSTNLLSNEFMQLARRHLDNGGIFYFNTTSSPDAMKTGMSAFPYGLRCVNFIALSDAPIRFDLARWDSFLRGYRRSDGRLAFDGSPSGSAARLDSLLAFGRSLNGVPIPYGLEQRASVLTHVAEAHIITDDNMLVEWRATPP
jgi:hypothetical protein